LRRRDNVIQVPVGSIRRIETVLVDALEVEDPAKLYEKQRIEDNPTTAVQWYNLALYAESLTLYEQAKQDLENCLTLDPGFSKRDLIEQRQKLLDVKIDEREQTEMLLRIQSMKIRGMYEEALHLAQTFLQQFPDSRQLSAVQREMGDIVERRRGSLLRSIRADYFSFFNRLCGEHATNRELSLGEAMTWAKEDAFGDSIDKLVTYYGISEEEVLDLWANRGNQGSPQTASYGGGTFVLGEAARKGLEKRDDEQDDESGEQKTEKTLQDRINEKLKEKAEQRESRRSEKSSRDTIADVPPTPDEWWAGASPGERRGFLQAFFAEQAGHVNVIRLNSRDCSTCAGKGILEFFAVNRTQGNVSGQEPCPRCKMLSFDRMVSYR